MERKLSEFKVGMKIEVKKANNEYTPVEVVKINGGEILFESNEVFGSLLYTSNKIKLSENSWPFKPGNTEIWYSNKDNFRDMVGGYSYNLQNETLPDPNNLSETHTLLGTTSETDLNKIFRDMQGENWSPNGSNTDYIKGTNISHMSMSVGDIIKIGDKVNMVDMIGFIDLNDPPK